MRTVSAIHIALEAIALRLNWYVRRCKDEPQDLVDAYDELNSFALLLTNGAEVRVTSETSSD